MCRKMAREPNTTTEETTSPASTARSKISVVQDLLRREEGATLAELVEATGWLPHTTPAALTGLRKKGHNLDKSKRGEATCYRIVRKLTKAELFSFRRFALLDPVGGQI